MGQRRAPVHSCLNPQSSFLFWFNNRFRVWPMGTIQSRTVPLRLQVSSPWPQTHLYEAVASLANDFYIQKLTCLSSHIQNLFFVSVQEAFFDARNRFGQFCVHLLLRPFPSKSVSQWYMEVLKHTGQGSPQLSDPLWNWSAHKTWYLRSSPVTGR